MQVANPIQVVLGDPSPPPLYLCPRRIAGSYLLIIKESLVLNVGNPLTSYYAKWRIPPLLIVICIHQVDLSLLETSSQ